MLNEERVLKLKSLFIGGPKDGERIAIRDHLQHVLVACSIPGSCDTFEEVHYRRLKFSGGEDVFVADEFSDEMVIQRLVDCYRRFDGSILIGLLKEMMSALDSAPSRSCDEWRSRVDLLKRVDAALAD